MKPPPALVPPAVAKWQFVEEKARAVLDAFCHREVRPPLAPPGDASLAPAATALAAFAQAYVQQASARPSADASVTRWYALGPILRSADGSPGWRPDYQIAAVVFGASGPSVEAELYGMAAHLLRECGVPGRQLQLILHPSDGASASHEREVFDLLTALGEQPQRGSAHAQGVNPVAFEISLRRPAPQAALSICEGLRAPHFIVHAGGAPTAAIAWAIDLGHLVAALDDQDEGYQPPISLVIVPVAPPARWAALRLAQRLRALGIRTQLEHGDLPPDAQLTRAAALGARLALVVPETDAPLMLCELASGQRHEVPPDDLESLVAQLLD